MARVALEEDKTCWRIAGKRYEVVLDDRGCPGCALRGPREKPCPVEIECKVKASEYWEALEHGSGHSFGWRER